MKWFEKLMNSGKGRVFWLVFMIAVLFIPLSQENQFVITIIEMFLAWFAIDYLSSKLNLKHKKIWKILALFFNVITYPAFLFIKRKQLREL